MPGRTGSPQRRPPSATLALSRESEGIPLGRAILLLAFKFAKMRTPAKTVNCYDPASYEDFIRLYSGEIAGFLEKYNESTQLVA